MRLTTAIWFAVFMRTESNRGAYVSVVKSGAQQAGAIFVVHNHLNGTCSLYAPAPQSLAANMDGDDRCFECVLAEAPEEQINAYLDKQKNFDPDLWVIETESGNGTPGLQLAG